MKDTKWKLSGIVNTNTGNLKVLEPNECLECYTLMFIEDYKCIVHSIKGTRKIDLLNLEPCTDLYQVLYCETYDKDEQDYCDVTEFYKAINRTASYKVTKNELKLFPMEGFDDYLLFKPFKTK